MADTIPQHFTTEFSTNWIHRVQQTKSRLSGFVEEDPYTGERKRYDRIGSQASHRRTERKGPTHIQDTTLDFRWAYRASFELGNMLDKDDASNLGQLVLPTSDYVKSHANAYHRDCDDVAWQAARNPVMTGELGATSTIFPYTTNWIGKGGAIGATTGTTSGLTIAKLILANEILEDADLEDGAERVLCITAKEITNLLNSTNVKSADYNSVRALVNGTVDSFMGFKFVKIKRLPRTDGATQTSTTAGNVTQCVAWVKGAVKVMKGSMMGQISQRADLSYATQIYSSWNLGATRIYDEGCIQIDCDSAATQPT